MEEGFFCPLSSCKVRTVILSEVWWMVPASTHPGFICERDRKDGLRSPIELV